MDMPQGALVAQVADDGPSHGVLEPGDVILAFDGKPVQDSRELPKLVGDTRAGAEISIDILRDGDRTSVKATIGTLGSERHAALDDDRGEAESDRLGATVAALTPEMRRRLGLDDSVAGAVITAVTPDGAAARAGLQPGDVITRIGGEPVTGPAELARALDQSETRAALMLINRRGDQIYIGVKLAA